MAHESGYSGGRDDGPGLVAGAMVLVVVGTLLGLAYNLFGLREPSGYGLAWIKEPRQLESIEDYLTPAGGPGTTAGRTASGGAGLPEIPATGQPLQIQLEAVKRFHAADGALFVDARTPDEYDAGHIAGAVNLPYETALPEDAEALDPGGRPVITYCDGGSCETSMNLAWDLVHAGHERVLVYLGGYPEWESRGYPTASGAAPPARADGETSSFTTDISDPMGFFGGADLPEIPELDRPMAMTLETFKQFFDADAAVILDAREPEEFEAGHIPGAIRLSFEDVQEDPSRLAELDPAGKPIVAYCGGGSCEVSMTLADALIAAGHRKVLVFTGGFPDWEAAGYPVARGREPRGG